MSDRDWLDSMVVTEAPATLVKRDDLLRLIALARKALDEMDDVREQKDNAEEAEAAYRDRAWAAEAELARLRPVVEAAKEKAEDHNEDTGGMCQCVVCRAVAALARAESDEKGGANG